MDFEWIKQSIRSHATTSISFSVLPFHLSVNLKLHLSPPNFHTTHLNPTPANLVVHIYEGVSGFSRCFISAKVSYIRRVLSHSSLISVRSSKRQCHGARFTLCNYYRLTCDRLHVTLIDAKAFQTIEAKSVYQMVTKLGGSLRSKQVKIHPRPVELESSDVVAAFECSTNALY